MIALEDLLLVLRGEGKRRFLERDRKLKIKDSRLKIKDQSDWSIANAMHRLSIKDF